jgi:hypothetical protein
MSLQILEAVYASLSDVVDAFRAANELLVRADAISCVIRQKVTAMTVGDS